MSSKRRPSSGRKFAIIASVLVLGALLSVWAGLATASAVCPKQELRLVAAVGSGPHIGAEDTGAARSEGWKESGHLMVIGQSRIVVYNAHVQGTFKAILLQPTGDLP
jgi:hypothetical protein